MSRKTPGQNLSTENGMKSLLSSAGRILSSSLLLERYAMFAHHAGMPTLFARYSAWESDVIIREGGSSLGMCKTARNACVHASN
jgi:hypothetical protein